MLDVLNQPVNMGTQEYSVALCVCGAFKVWSRKMQRSRITAQLSSVYVSGSICPAQNKQRELEQSGGCWRYHMLPATKQAALSV